MGTVDLVVQVESPPSVASGLQRVGRAGHQVGAVSRGVLFPTYRANLVASAVVAERMRNGQIEALAVPANPLDVLAQQIVAMVAMDDWPVADLLRLLQRSAPFSALTAPVLESVLDMLAGRYPSEEFAELRPRLVWDRITGVLSARSGAQRLAVTSGGTIADRGLFGVFLAGGEGSEATRGARRGGRRVGELDEEMVYESRVGDVFTLGASSWQITDITYDQVLVVPAPGRAGRLPFWHGEQQGRPYELGSAIGGFVRELAALDEAGARARLAKAGLDDWATDNLLGYLREQAEATTHLPDDRTIVVERFRDELGDWRVVVHSPFGRDVHAPWAMAIAGAMRAEHGVDVQAMPADDGIVLRLPYTDLLMGDDTLPMGDAARLMGGDAQSMVNDVGAAPNVVAALMLSPDEVVQRVTDELGGSALFASRFRECAARALLLPRRRPDRRSPLWQQRQRSAQLLEVASRYPTFPIILETVRECLADVFDVPALRRLLTDLASGAVRVVEVETQQPSPFARSLLFGYVAQFLYEGDTPLAERRAAALSLDPELLAELLGSADGAGLADLLDPDSVRTTHEQLQCLTRTRQARNLDGVADLVRVLGPLTPSEIAARCQHHDVLATWLDELVAARRLIRVRIGGADLMAAAEDAGRLRDALGTPLPVGLPVAFTELVDDPLTELLARHARTRAGFTAEQVAARWGLGVAVVRQGAQRLVQQGRLVSGDLLPGACYDLLGWPTGAPVPVQYCHTEVMRTLRRRSLAALRAEVEPVPPRELARFVPAWQHIERPLRGVDGVLRIVEQLAGLALPASAWESMILPARVSNYSPGMLDELTAAGEIVWAGHGALGGDDGWISLHPVDLAPYTMPLPDPGLSPLTPVQEAIEHLLQGGGGYFIRQLVEAIQPLARPVPALTPGAGQQHAARDPLPAGPAQIGEALWDLVWRGRVSGDTLAPVRALSSRRGAPTSRRAPVRARYGRRPSMTRLRPGPGARTSPDGLALLDPSGRYSGRWSALPAPDPDATVRAAVLAETLLDRYGVVTRGSVLAEDHPGGFAVAYRVLAKLEESGRVRRGYFVEGLGASQFATAAAVDRLRAAAPSSEPMHSARSESRPVVLAATDPANVYGAAVAWPDSRGDGHRPARRAGALVVLADGNLLTYLERGARTLLTFTDDPEQLASAATALARVVSNGQLGALTVQTVDGAPVLGSGHPLEGALQSAGFHPTPKGLRLRR